MTDEYEILDTIYEAIAPDQDLSMSLYGINGDMTRPEMYVRVNGECWRILAERHPHPDDPDEFCQSCRHPWESHQHVDRWFTGGPAHVCIANTGMGDPCGCELRKESK